MERANIGCRVWARSLGEVVEIPRRPRATNAAGQDPAPLSLWRAAGTVQKDRRGLTLLRSRLARLLRLPIIALLPCPFRLPQQVEAAPLVTAALALEIDRNIAGGEG